MLIGVRSQTGYEGDTMFARLISLLRAEGGFTAIEYGLAAAFGLIAVGELIAKL